MMKCSSCGAELRDGARFCSVCGTKTDDSTEPSNVQPTVQMPNPKTAPSAAPASQDASGNEPEKPKKKRTVLKIVGGVVALAIVALAILVALNWDIAVAGFRSAQEDDLPAGSAPVAEPIGSNEPEADEKTDEEDTSEGAAGDAIANPVTVSGIMERTDAYGRQHVVFDVANDGSVAFSSVPVRITATKVSRDSYDDLVEETVDITGLSSVCDVRYVTSGSYFGWLEGYFAPGKTKTVDLTVMVSGDVSYSNFEVVPANEAAREADETVDHPFDENDFTVNVDWSQNPVAASITNETGHYLSSCSLTYLACDESGDPWYPSDNANGDNFYTVTFEGGTLKPGESFEDGQRLSNEALSRATWRLIRIDYTIDADKEASTES